MIDLQQIVAAVATVGARITGVLIFAPVLGSPALPMRIKVGFAIALTALLYPAVGSIRTAATPTAWLRVCLSELLLGALLGLATNLVFDAVQFAGQILGVQMGYSLANIIDPTSQVDTPVLSVFHQTIAILIFLRLDVHHWILRGLARSFEYLPSGAALGNGHVAEATWHAAACLWVCGLQIAAPALAATMMIDVILGFIGKASPQLPVMLLGVSVKSVAGLVTTVIAMAFWPRWFERYFAESIGLTERLLRLAH